MKDSYINMAIDLQKHLPLDISLLMYQKCLDPANRKMRIPVVRIGKLAQLLSHAITDREVVLVQD